MNPPDTADDLHFRALAAWLIALGALGLVATSVSYALAGPQAAMPGGATSVEAARSATAAAAGWMRAAGLFGMPSDVLLAVGGLMLASTKQGNGLGFAGWLAMSIAGALFVVVDAMVGFVLPVAAVHGDAAYVAARALFDVLFAIGGWTVGAGALAAAWHAQAPEYRWRAALWLLRVSGAVCLLANSVHLLGLPGSRLIGPGIALLAVALFVLALSLLGLRSPRPAVVSPTHPGA
jgi:hypothetical protein